MKSTVILVLTLVVIAGTAMAILRGGMRDAQNNASIERGMNARQGNADLQSAPIRPSDPENKQR